MEELEDSRSSRRLSGTDPATIDDKGRILIPKKKRERLGEDFTLALGTDECIEAYPKAHWERVVGEIERFSPLNEGRRHYSRLKIGLAEEEMRCDAQGRVVIPPKLRELANLRDSVVLVGCGERLEIWDKATYEQFEAKNYGDRKDAVTAAYQQMTGETPR